MKKYFLLTALLIMNVTLINAQKSFHDFTVKDISGKDISLAEFKGKKVLVVNTASKCGLTPQYKGLQKLYAEYGGDNFTIIGFPTNDFAKQEPGTNEEIATFCEVNYGVEFPMMSKITVKGEETHPLYKWLTTKDENGLKDSKVSWNFQKYLIDEEGRLVGHFAPQTKPTNRKIIRWIRKK